MSYTRALSRFYRLSRLLDGLSPTAATAKAKQLVAYYYPTLAK